MCHVLFKMTQWFWRRRLLKNLKKVFCNYLLFEDMWPCIWTNLNSVHPRMLCAKFGWNWTIGSGEDFFLSFQCNFTISQLSPLWEKAWPFIWTNLNPLNPRMLPFTQECFIASLVEIDPVVLEKIFKSFQLIFIFSQLSSLSKGRGPSFEQTWIRFIHVYFVPSLVEIVQVDLEKKMKM